MTDPNLGSVSGQRKWQPSQTRAIVGASASDSRSREPARSIEQRTNAAEERYKLPGVRRDAQLAEV